MVEELQFFVVIVCVLSGASEYIDEGLHFEEVLFGLLVFPFLDVLGNCRVVEMEYVVVWS